MSLRLPELGEPTPAAFPSAEAVRLMRLRRSTSPDLMADPGPDAETLRVILEIGARAPDHRRLYPFRFIVIEGERRAAAGALLAARLHETDPSADEAKLQLERRRFLRAPVVIAVASRIDPNHKTPEWEQILTNGAVCENLLIAANAHGFASCWLTEWAAYDAGVRAGLGLEDRERIAGFIYVGSAKEPPKERPRPDLSSLITRF